MKNTNKWEKHGGDIFSYGMGMKDICLTERDVLQTDFNASAKTWITDFCNKHDEFKEAGWMTPESISRLDIVEVMCAASLPPIDLNPSAGVMLKPRVR